MKKVNKLIIIVFILLSCSFVFAACKKAQISEGLEFYLTNDGSGYEVDITAGITDTEIIIPAKYKGKPVTEIRHVTSLKAITNIVIPNSVTIIRKSAFNSCKDLKSIIIPNSVISIEAEAFAFCESLAEIIIPDSVIYIGSQAFLHCIGLSEISIGTGVTGIGEHAFFGCSNLTTVIVQRAPENGCTELNFNVFGDCFLLNTIYVPHELAYKTSPGWQDYSNFIVGI